jgi:hypothetical protein
MRCSSALRARVSTQTYPSREKNALFSMKSGFSATKSRLAAINRVFC